MAKMKINQLRIQIKKKKRKMKQLFQMIKKNIEGLEAIYINPKWQKSKVGDFLTFDKKKGKKKSKKEKYQIINS